MTPCISVIVPVYNAEKYLSACLDSFCSQTMQEVEIICINDGSTDRSGKILDEYAQKDSRFRILHQSNSGAAIARNRGLAEACGKYLMFCDSDDRYESDMCEQMYYAMEKYKVDFAVCNTFVEQTDRVDFSLQRYLSPKKLGVVYLDDRFLHRMSINVWNKIFRKEIIDKYNICFPDIYSGEDAAFCRSFFLVAEKAFFLEKKLYHYYLRDGSITDNCNRKTNYRYLFSDVQSAEYLYVFLKSHSLIKKHDKFFMRCYLNSCKKAWTAFSLCYRGELLDEIRHFVLNNEIGQLRSKTGKRLFRALQSGNNYLAVKLIDRVPGVFKKLVLILKYSFLSFMKKDEKRKRYRRKLIHLLYQKRALDRLLDLYEKKSE